MASLQLLMSFEPADSFGEWHFCAQNGLGIHAPGGCYPVLAAPGQFQGMNREQADHARANNRGLLVDLVSKVDISERKASAQIESLGYI